MEVTTNWLSPTQSGTIASGITYNALGEPVSDTLNDGKSESWNYNVNGHVTTFSGGSYPGYNFGFSPSSLTWTGDLLTSSSDNVNGSWTYTYDDFARLQSASGSQNFVYGYDQYANRWSTMTGTQQYSFNGVNNHITSNGFAYDAAGNVTNDSIHSYTYDAERRLKAVDSGNTAKYNYDAFGNRTMQFSTTPAVYNEYVVDLSGRAITAIQPGTSNVYTAEVFAGGRHWVTDNGSALFLGADWLGTTRALTELNGTFAQLYPSLPWGDGLSSGGSSFDTTSQYTGKEYDPESGLYHFPARQYAPVQGRWLTPDPAGLSAMSLDSPQSWNRYAYVLNNPVSNIDPTGLYPGGDCDTADAGCTGDGGVGDTGGSGGCWEAMCGSDGVDPSSDCPICTGPYGSFGTQGISNGFFQAGQIWGTGGATVGGISYLQEEDPKIEEIGDYLDELQALIDNALEPIDMEAVWRCVGCIFNGQKGPLNDRDAKNFQWYLPVTLKGPSTFYRYWGGPAGLSGSNGTYYSFFPPEGSQEFYREQFSLPSQWNSMQNLNGVTVPPGTTVYIGPAAGQGPYNGGGLQVYVPNL